MLDRGGGLVDSLLASNFGRYERYNRISLVYVDFHHPVSKYGLKALFSTVANCFTIFNFFGHTKFLCCQQAGPEIDLGVVAQSVCQATPRN